MTNIYMQIKLIFKKTKIFTLLKYYKKFEILLEIFHNFKFREIYKPYLQQAL